MQTEKQFCEPIGCPDYRSHCHQIVIGVDFSVRKSNFANQNRQNAVIVPRDPTLSLIAIRDIGFSQNCTHPIYRIIQTKSIHCVQAALNMLNTGENLTASVLY